MASIFTKIINGEIPSYKIAENELYYAFLDINPTSKGHTLVVPKQETDYIFDLEDEVLAGLHIFAKKIADAIKKTVDCERVAVAVVGLEVPHAHVHLIPIKTMSDFKLGKKISLKKDEFIQIAEDISNNVSL